MFSTDAFLAGLQEALGLAIRVNEDDVVGIRKSTTMEGLEKESVVIQLSLSEMEAIALELQDKYTCNGSMLTHGCSFEVAVQAHDRFRGPIFRPDRTSYEVVEHDYHFEISKATIEYIFGLLCYFSSNPSPNFELGPLRPHRDEAIQTVDELIDTLRIVTVKVRGPREFSEETTRSVLDSYLFNISFNYSIALSAIDFSNNSRRVGRRTRRDGQLFPYKAYNAELTKYYHQAVSADNPFTQYLAFYHVAEFYFQSISEQDALDEIKMLITAPSFSPYSKRDVRSFYEKIKKKFKDQREDGVWNESAGLLLCLRKYVNLESLQELIKTADSSALMYYEEHETDFADGGKKINFSDDPEKIYISIRDRVYSVRNSIVHSKDGKKRRYEPFRHDKQLAKEVPLIRCIAEEIIVNSANSLETLLKKS